MKVDYSDLRMAILNKKDFILALLGMLLLMYVFYCGFYDLPPVLTNTIVFVSIFLGLSFVLSWKNVYFTALILIIYLILFFLPLTWLWRGLEFDFNVLMGIFPFNDGMYYLKDAYRLLIGLDATMAPNGRPIYTGMLAFLMWSFGDNIQIALAIFCAITAISIYLLALEMREIAGPFSAGLATTILFYFSLPFVGRVHTESLGLAFGSLALSILLMGVRKKNIALLALGFFCLSLALNVRAGAFFVLPALFLWAWFNGNLMGKYVPLLIIGSVCMGFIINIAVLKLIGGPNGIMFSNYGHTLYGLASGYKGWAYIYSVYPDFSNETNVFPYAIELILKDPFSLLKGILLSYKDYLNPETMFMLMRFNAQQTIISWFLYSLSIIGLYRLIKLRKKLYFSLVLFSLGGILLSVGLIPPVDDGLRALMATHPLNAFLAAMAFFSADTKFQGVFEKRVSITGIFAISLIVVCGIGPFIVVNFPENVPSLPILDCPDGAEQISVKISDGSYINVVKKGRAFGFIPSIRKEDIKSRFDNYHYQKNHPFILTEFESFTEVVKKLQDGDTILIGLNLTKANINDELDHYVFLLTRTDQIHNFGEINNFCAFLADEDRLRSNYFYFDQSINLRRQK
jgi:hypothetical protein